MDKQEVPDFIKLLKKLSKDSREHKDEKKKYRPVLVNGKIVSE